MAVSPGTRKLPLQPTFPEQLDPKIERVMRWQWEELVRYINGIAVSVPFLDNNYTGNYEIGGKTFQQLPLGNYNNFADPAEWLYMPCRYVNITLANGNMNCNVTLNGVGNASFPRHWGRIRFQHLLTPDENWELSYRMRFEGVNCFTDSGGTSAGFRMMLADIAQHMLRLRGPLGANNWNDNNWEMGQRIDTSLASNFGAANVASNNSNNIEAMIHLFHNGANHYSSDITRLQFYYKRDFDNNFTLYNANNFQMQSVYNMRGDAGIQIGFATATQNRPAHGRLVEFEVLKGQLYGYK